MQISHEISDRVLIVSLSGSFDMYSASLFDEEIEKLLEHYKPKTLGLNLEKLSNLDSSGVGSLIRKGKEMQKSGLDLAIFQAPSRVLNILVASGLNELYQILTIKQFETHLKDKKSKKASNQIFQKLKNSFKMVFNHNIFILFCIIIIFIFSAGIIEWITYSNEKKNVSELSNIVQSYLWEVDDSNGGDFAKLLIDTKDYELVKITHPDNSIFVEIISDGKNNSFLEKFLTSVFLIRKITISSQIIHKDSIIGTMQVEWKNKNIYFHLVLALMYSLLYIIITAYIRIIKNRKELNRKNIEISEKMAEVEKLKIQQDGDYYLTSLLTKPLGKLKAESDLFRFEMFVRQKKRFEFRKKTEDIGGDFCLTDRITLRNKNYILFVNADAMGKSLQGAGGSIVFGSALNSFITRNRSSKSVQNFFPEIWLKNSFVDLHKVFETFGGSMLISLVLGLIDEEAGFIYWINAEHPSAILYRDGKASFIDNDDIFMKLGTEGVDRELYIKTLQLYIGDVIILGSDGRDDFVVGKDENGNILINEDEKKILQNVESSEANLEKIYENIKNSGEMADDLSLMKIEYLGPKFRLEEDGRFKSLLEQSKRFVSAKEMESAKSLLLSTHKEYLQSAEVLKILIRIYQKEESYAEICEFIDKYLVLNPSDQDHILLASIAHKQIKDFGIAIAYGERFKARNPNHIENLLNLYELYFSIENYEKSISVLEKILQIDPSNERALILKGKEFDENF